MKHMFDDPLDNEQTFVRRYRVDEHTYDDAGRAAARKGGVMAVIAYPLSTSSRSRQRLGVRQPTLERRVPETPQEQLRLVTDLERAVPARRVSASVRRHERGRQLLAALALMSCAVGLWIGLGALGSLRSPGEMRLVGAQVVPGGYEYVVRPGDTLWSIATAVAPNNDPRPLVDALETEIGGGVLRVGEHLHIPSS